MTSKGPGPGGAHPAHEAVAAQVRRWFTESAPEIGYEVSQHWYGHLGFVGPSQSRVLLGVAAPDRVPAALAEARAASGARTLMVWIDDRKRAARLDPVLRDSGCRPGDAITYLALVGAMSGRPGPPDLVVQSVGEAGLADWARVKLQSFGDSEAAPPSDRLDAEIAWQRTQRALVDHQLGLLGGEPAAIMAYYHGPDQLVFNLGTRVPYRRLGIAQEMLARWVAAGASTGCRSMIINALERGRPAELYRGLGFCDEVYWYQEYEAAAG